MKPKVPIDLIDSRDGHLGLVRQFWDGFATAAWEGYLQGGRGAVLLDLSAANDMDINADSIAPLMDYLALNSGFDFGDGPLKSLKRQLEDYDPEKEIMVLVYRRTFNMDGDFAFYRLPHADLSPPPIAFEEYAEEAEVEPEGNSKQISNS